MQLETFSDRQRFPRVAAVSRYLRASSLDAVFEFGLDLLFDEIRKQAVGKRGRDAESAE